MAQTLRHNASVEKALANLRAMGLQVDCLPENEDEVMIFINLESLCKLVSRRIPYPQKKVYVELPFMVVHLWRG
jgi:hypothetical protein